MKQSIRKLRTAEHRLFELCKPVIDSYSEYIDYSEAKLEELRKGSYVFGPEAPGRIDHEMFMVTLHSLQTLLGSGWQYSHIFPKPRTLEAALKDVGVDEKYIAAEVNILNEYHEKARSLWIKDSELADKWVHVTYDTLLKKMFDGNELNEYEKLAFESAADVLSSDH